MNVHLTSYEWKSGRFIIQCDYDIASTIERHIVDHCTATFDDPEHINDSRQNRHALEVIMSLHGCQCVWTKPLPVKRKKGQCQ